MWVVNMNGPETYINWPKKKLPYQHHSQLGSNILVADMMVLSSPSFFSTMFQHFSFFLNFKDEAASHTRYQSSITETCSLNAYTPVGETWFGDFIIQSHWEFSHLCLTTAKIQSRKSSGEGMQLQTGDREKEPWGVSTMALAEKNSVCAPLPPPGAHTPHVKPSDACTAALTCQSQLGEGQLPLTKPPSECILERALKKTCKEVLDLWVVLMECEKVLKALCVAWSGRENVRGCCVRGCKKGWARDVSVGGIEERTRDVRDKWTV